MLTASPFDTIKETLRIGDIIRSYGVEIKRGNQALCPFHNEKTPSFTIFPQTNSFKCFGCGVGGSSIDFVMQMCGTNALEAAKKLDMDYNLGLFDCKVSREERERLSEQQAQREVYKGLDIAFKGYMSKAYSLLFDYLHLLYDWKIEYAPKTIDEWGKVNALFVEACHQLDYIEYLTDYLLSADFDTQIGFYQTHREELMNLATRLCTIGSKADEQAQRGYGTS